MSGDNYTSSNVLGTKEQLDGQVYILLVKRGKRPVIKK